jgi:hypothetical protein
MRVTKGGQNNNTISDNDKGFIQFLSDARTGNVTSLHFQKFLNKLNLENLVDYDHIAYKKAHPNALWISNKKVDGNK